MSVSSLLRCGDCTEKESQQDDRKQSTRRTGTAFSITCFPAWVLIFFIKLYRKLISPFLGECCRFYPSCSQYAIDALEQHGIIKGLWLAIRRILKCQPWCEGGFDPVPRRAKEDGCS